MEKKAKDTLRRYKKPSRPHSSSDSSTSDSDTGSSSYSSTDSEMGGGAGSGGGGSGGPPHHGHPHGILGHDQTRRSSEQRHNHRKKKNSRRAASSSGDEQDREQQHQHQQQQHHHHQRRKRDKREQAVQKKLVAKRNHIKRKLKEARLKKRAAAAAAALSGHSHRSLSPATQAKLKKLAERKHLRAASKEQREREKLRAVQRDRERDHHRLGSSRSPPSSSTTTTTKIRIHQDVLGKRQKSPLSGSSSGRLHHHHPQLISREKIIIQTRTRGRTPSLEREREREREREQREREREQRERERERHQHHHHHDLTLRERDRRDRDRERAEREAARDKERAEALARCQERQRERERLAREKLRRQDEDEKRGCLSGAAGRDQGDMPPYGSRERSLDRGGAAGRHGRGDKRVDLLDPYEREREREQDYIEERHGQLIDDMRRYGGHRRGRELSPLVAEHYAPRMHNPREMYSEEERERAYKRAYLDARYSSRERDAWLDARELTERELQGRDYRDLESEDPLYADERERMLRERERERDRERERERERQLGAGGGGGRAGGGGVKYRAEWEREWDEDGVSGPGPGASGTPGRASGFVGGPKRGTIAGKPPSQQAQHQQQQQHHSASEPDWDADERDRDREPEDRPEAGGAVGGGGGVSGAIKQEPAWVEHDQRDKPRTWGQTQSAQSGQGDWRDTDNNNGRGNAVANEHAASSSSPHHHHLHGRGDRQPPGGGGGRGFRRAGGGHEHGERVGGGGGYRSHPPPLMTLPVQPPGGYHGGGGVNSRGFAHKRMPYTGGGGAGGVVSSGGSGPSSFLKKHPHIVPLATGNASANASSPGIGNSGSSATGNPSPLLTTPLSKPHAGAQASAVAAATTAVAAAKAAAQSAANATTNPGILAQVSSIKLTHIKQEQDGSEDSTLDTPAASSAATAAVATGTIEESSSSSPAPAVCQLKQETATTNGELSEISDSDDDILNKTDKVRPSIKSELQEADNGLPSSQELSTDTLSNSDEMKTESNNQQQQQQLNGTTVSVKTEEMDVVLDFEEISDGELEEDARHKGIGDALGVDWQGLIAETRQQAAQQQSVERSTSAKQRWQPHRIFLDMGLSFKMAGGEYAQSILQDARQQLQREKQEKRDSEPGDLDQKVVIYRDYLASDTVEPLACVQMGLRSAAAERQRLVGNVCGPGSRALSARQDLRLRRQLCGLPPRECDFPRNVPTVAEGVRSLAMQMFNRTLNVK